MKLAASMWTLEFSDVGPSMLTDIVSVSVMLMLEIKWPCLLEFVFVGVVLTAGSANKASWRF
jgi:hypothetical protein